MSDDYTVEGYDIRLERREDGFINYSIAYIDKDGKPRLADDQCVTLEYALQEITSRIRSHKAGAF
jgi:hypothetical protein